MALKTKKKISRYGWEVIQAIPGKGNSRGGRVKRGGLSLDMKVCSSHYSAGGSEGRWGKSRRAGRLVKELVPYEEGLGFLLLGMAADLCFRESSRAAA